MTARDLQWETKDLARIQAPAHKAEAGPSPAEPDGGQGAAALPPSGAARCCGCQLGQARLVSPTRWGRHLGQTLPVPDPTGSSPLVHGQCPGGSPFPRELNVSKAVGLSANQSPQRVWGSLFFPGILPESFWEQRRKGHGESGLLGCRVLQLQRSVCPWAENSPRAASLARAPQEGGDGVLMQDRLGSHWHIRGPRTSAPFPS